MKMRKMRKRREKDVLGCAEQPLWQKIVLQIIITFGQILKIIFVMVTVFFAVVAIRIAIKGEAHWYNIPFVGGEMLYLYFISKRDNENWLELVPLLIASLVYLIHY